MNYDLTDEIRDTLKEQCGSRCLDDEEDFDIVVEVISSVVDQWIHNRCPGCR